MIAPTAHADDFIFHGKPPEFEDYGYLIRNAQWTFGDGAEPVIFVCWENPASKNEQERGSIQDQISQTWQQHTRIAFYQVGRRAPEKNSGIRIAFVDEGPHVNAFGRHLNGLKNGMVLNLTFENWSQACQQMREMCIRSIAAHEFGHALGFAHEQNRPDTPGECSSRHGQRQPNEEPLTPYDPSSVMNYCNPEYNNNGQLSALDIEAAEKVYGRR